MKGLADRGFRSRNTASEGDYIESMFVILLHCSLVAQMVKHLPAMQVDLGSVPGSGRSSGEGNGNPLQYLCPENPMDGGASRLQSMESQRVRRD